MSDTGNDQTGTAGVVTWDFSWFSARYPDLAAAAGPANAQFYFDAAQMFLDNTPMSVVKDVATRQRLLGLLTAHVAALFSPVDGQPSGSLVGRITNASEGSVSVAADLPSNPNSGWYEQTKYGALYWAATALYRRMRYYPGPQPFKQIPFWGYPGV